MANNAIVSTSFETKKKNSDFILEVVFSPYHSFNGFEEGED